MFPRWMSRIPNVPRIPRSWKQNSGSVRLTSHSPFALRRNRSVVRLGIIGVTRSIRSHLPSSVHSSTGTRCLVRSKSGTSFHVLCSFRLEFDPATRPTISIFRTCFSLGSPNTALVAPLPRNSKSFSVAHLHSSSWGVLCQGRSFIHREYLVAISVKSIWGEFTRFSLPPVQGRRGSCYSVL